MKQASRLLRRLGQPMLPVALLVILAILCVCSFTFIGVLMRPNGDDYGWLNVYHQSDNWLKATLYALQHDNGRYAQNISVAIPYGIAGEKFLKLVSLLSISIFIGVAYLATRALQKITETHFSKWQSLAFAALSVLAYITMSVTFIGGNGDLDGTFQGFQWYPGFVTYTLPILLLCAVVSLCILYRDRLLKLRFWPLYCLFAGTFAGLYGEIPTIIYISSLGLISAVWLVLMRNIRTYLNRAKPFLYIAAGTLLGLFLIYTSPASRARRQTLQVNDSLGDILMAALRGTRHYLTTYLVDVWWVIVAVLCIGGTIALYMLARKQAKPLTLLRYSIIGLFIGSTLGVTSLFVSFASIFKGYGLTIGYIVPRFEILYNIWFCVAWLCLGSAATCAVLSVLKSRLSATQTIATLTTVLSLCIIIVAPLMIMQMTARIKKIAIYSQKWDATNAYIYTQKGEGAKIIHVPVIDIGDGYGMPCNDTAKNWLGDVKAHYYGVDVICTPQQLSAPSQ